MSYIPLINHVCTGGPLTSFMLKTVFYEIMYYDDTWKIPRITDCSYDVYRGLWYPRIMNSVLYPSNRGRYPDPANTKHLLNICTMLDQRRRRWADVLQMLCKCFVFTGDSLHPLTLRVC